MILFDNVIVIDHKAAQCGGKKMHLRKYLQDIMPGLVDQLSSFPHTYIIMQTLFKTVYKRQTSHWLVIR